MGAYHYFMASVPALMRRATPPLSSHEYVALLAVHLSPAAARQLASSGLFDACRSLLEPVINGDGQMMMEDDDGSQEGRASATDSATGGTADSMAGGTTDSTADSTADGTTDSTAVAAWHLFDAGLRAEVARLRAAALKVETDVHWPQMESFIYIEELRRIFQQVNPMKRELQIHDLRWNFLDGLEDVHRGQIGAAIVYYIRLQLLERLQTMEHDAAHKKLGTIYAQCHAQFQQKINAPHIAKGRYHG